MFKCVLKNDVNEKGKLKLYKKIKIKIPDHAQHDLIYTLCNDCIIGFTHKIYIPALAYCEI